MVKAGESIVPEYRNSFALFVAALDYIEQNLCSDFTQESIAAECYCSLSSLQKTWKYCTHMSIKEYISKRRLTLAGRAMLEDDLSALDAALRFGYNSPEVFTRAFTKVWGVSPSKFKKQWKGNCVLYPRLNPAFLEGAEIMNVKKFDVTEFYDYLRSNAGTYVLCCDIEQLEPINNELGREAGDKCILEAFRRINEAAGDMLTLRIGGDEFAVITESSDSQKIIELAERIISSNGKQVVYSKGEVPMSLRCGAIKINEQLKYSLLCEDFDRVLNKARVSGKIEFMS